MPVFISHSHQDKDFVDKLAAQLILHKEYIWLDRWEIKVGDSIIDKIQEAIQSASAFIIVLSKASVGSEWCRKELNAGLIRELEERRIVVLPLLLEDCDIPIFLREKKYADFRNDFDAGLGDTLVAISAVTSDTQRRIEQPHFHTDFGMAWGTFGPFYGLQLRFIDHSEMLTYCVLTEIKIVCNENLTQEFYTHEGKGSAALGRLKIVTVLKNFVESTGAQVFTLEDSLPKTQKLYFVDEKKGLGLNVDVSSMKLGQDTGMDVLLDWAGHIEKIWQDLVQNLSPEDRGKIKDLE